MLASHVVAMTTGAGITFACDQKEKKVLENREKLSKKKHFITYTQMVKLTHPQFHWD